MSPAFIYLGTELVPKFSNCPSLFKPMYGFDLSSRSGPPVTYQSNHTTQKPMNIFMRIPIAHSI